MPALAQDAEWVPPTVTSDGTVIPGFWAGCIAGCDSGSGGGGGDSPSAFDGVSEGFDFSPEIVDALTDGLVGFDRDAAVGGDGSAEKRFKQLVNQFKSIGNLMPNRGPLGGDWDPATAPRWREEFALQWYAKPVLFTVPDDLNTAWAQFFRDRALREQARHRRNAELNRRLPPPGEGPVSLGSLTPLEPVPFNRRLDSGETPIERMFPNRDPETLALATRGVEAMQAKDYARAVDELEKALARNPKDEGIRETLRQARALLADEQAQHARDSNRESPRAAPGERGAEVAAHIAEGKAAILAGDLKGANVAYSNASVAGNAEDEGLRNASFIVRATPNLEEGSRELFAAAVDNIRSGNYTGAVQQLREAVERNPGDADARSALYEALGLLSSANQELLGPLSRQLISEPARSILGDAATIPQIAYALEALQYGDTGTAISRLYPAVRWDQSDDQRVLDAYALLNGYQQGQNAALFAERARAERSPSLFDPFRSDSFNLLEAMTPPQEQTLKETIVTAVQPVAEALAAADKAIIEYFGRTFVPEQTPIADANLENVTVVAVRVGEVENPAASVLVDEALRSLNAGDIATAGLMLDRAAERDPGNERIADASRYVQGLYEMNRQIETDTGQVPPPTFAAVQNSVTTAAMMVTAGPPASIQARALAEEAVESIRIGNLDRASGLLEAAAIREPDSEGIQAARAFVNYIVERGPEPAPSTAAAARYDRETENLTGAAWAAEALGRNDVAVQFWQTAVARNPGDAALAANLARAQNATRASENIETVSRSLVIRGPGLVR